MALQYVVNICDALTFCSSGMYFLYQQLYSRGGIVVLVLLDCEADIERLSGMNIIEVLGGIERYAVEYLSGGVVDEFELYVFELSAYELACAEIQHVSCAEHRFLVSRSERIEFP